MAQTYIRFIVLSCSRALPLCCHVNSTAHHLFWKLFVLLLVVGYSILYHIITCLCVLYHMIDIKRLRLKFEAKIAIERYIKMFNQNHMLLLKIKRQIHLNVALQP